MKLFKADLHIHSVLSPCASLEMSPGNIVQAALDQHLDIIGITDHNSTRQCRQVIEVAHKTQLKVFTGVEITTREEVHCLAFFEHLDVLDAFQQYLDEHLPKIKNNPDLFGYQVVVDENENIVYEEDFLLITGLNKGINEIEKEVRKYGGIFIPAHIDKPKYSLTSQLGFIPPDLAVDAFELSRHTPTKNFLAVYPNLKNSTFIRNSDAHQPDLIGTSFTYYRMDTPCFDEFRMALLHQNGREVIAA
ncbi:MAG: PHP domain-containing protein [Lentimicrobium sp.]|jgi:hypothetical protein|nr:PHP domain-containing protein [Lentimicrobium sp.]MDD2526525.1 PHP domain-containing protein [Lentimicrobiaceae bacterium]MDD4596341.1 PHP domain-containing protein [Lentimicrobiaceae bacterium]MDY0025536.1 PHP domain-containing protein [Lentimicrobium sp.]